MVSTVPAPRTGRRRPAYRLSFDHFIHIADHPRLGVAIKATLLLVQQLVIFLRKDGLDVLVIDVLDADDFLVVFADERADSIVQIRGNELAVDRRLDRQLIAWCCSSWTSSLAFSSSICLPWASTGLVAGGLREFASTWVTCASASSS